MSTDTRWFQGVLADHDISQRQLAMKLGIDPAAVSLMFRGKRKITMKEAAGMARILGVPLDDVVRHAGIAPPELGESVAVIGRIEHKWEVFYGDAPGPARVECPPSLAANVAALRIVFRGDVLDGGLVFYVPREGAIETGRLCIVRLKDGRTLVRAVSRGYSKGMYRLTVVWVGGEAAEEAEVEWAVPVEWMKL